MKTKLFLLSLIVAIGYSCSTPKDTAIDLLKDFSNDLKKIENPQKISVYELDKQISSAVEKLNKNRDNELAELSKDEDIRLFENFFKVDEVKEYKDLLTILTNRNLQTVEQIKGKYWVETKTKDINSIFSVDDSYFSLLNSKESFAYQILNGSIICDNQKIFLEIKDRHLSIFSQNQKAQEFEEATREDMLIGKWIKRNGGKAFFVFKKNGKGIAKSR